MDEDDLGTIGPYHLVDKIGSGGMATLYLATKEGIAGFRRAVAIKVVGELLADHPDFVKMFLDEARLAARIRHPNVIYTEDLGEDEGRHYIVMEYVHGGSVGEIIKELFELGRRMSPAFAVSVIAAAAEGLHAAHEAKGSDGERLGIVHRDVSPQNVLVSAEGAVKLIDFGVARADERLHQTLNPGAMKGKLRYMPPEQLDGDQGIDRRADVFSMGVVLWEMVTGQRIFGRQTNDQVTKALREGRLPRLGEVVPEVPEGLEQAVAQALEHDPDDRPESARAFRQLLLDAVPEAREVDAVERAAMVQAIMAPKLDARAKRLSVVGATALNTRELSVAPVQALQKWTLPKVEVGSMPPRPSEGGTQPAKRSASDPPSKTSEAAGSSPGSAESSTPATQPMIMMAKEEDPMPFKRHALLLVGLVLLTFLGLGWMMYSRAQDTNRAEPTIGPSPMPPIEPPLEPFEPVDVEPPPDPTDESTDESTEHEPESTETMARPPTMGETAVEVLDPWSSDRPERIERPDPAVVRMNRPPRMRAGMSEASPDILDPFE